MLFDAATWKKILFVPSTGGVIPEVAFSPDEQLMVSYSDTSTIGGAAVCWNMKSRKPVYSWTYFEQPRPQNFSRDGRLLVVSGYLSSETPGKTAQTFLFRVLDAATGQLICNGTEWSAGASAPTNMMFSDDNAFVFLEYGESSVSVCDATDGQEVVRLPYTVLNSASDAPLVNPSGFCRFSNTTKELEVVRPPAPTLSQARSRSVMIPDLAVTVVVDKQQVSCLDFISGQEVSAVPLKYHVRAPDDNVLPFTKDQQFWIGTVERDGKHVPVIRRTDTLDIVRELSVDPQQVMFSPDSEHVAGVTVDSAPESSTIQIVALRSEQSDIAVTIPQVDAFAFAADGKHLCAVTTAQDLIVVDIGSPDFQTGTKDSSSEIQELVCEFESVPVTAGRNRFVTANIRTSRALTAGERILFRLAADAEWMSDADGTLRFRVPADAEQVQLEVKAVDADGVVTAPIRQEIGITENLFDDWHLLFTHNSHLIGGAMPLVNDRDSMASSRQKELPYGNVRFAPDGMSLIAFGGQRSIRSWKLSAPSATGFSTTKLPASQFGEFTPDGKMLCIGTVAGTVQVWNVRRGTAESYPLESRRGGEVCVSVSPDGKLVAGMVQTQPDKLYLMSVKDGNIRDSFPLPGSRQRPVGLVWSPNDDLFVTTDGTTMTALNRDGSVRWQQSLPTDGSLTYCRDGSSLCCRGNNVVHILTADDGVVTETWTVPLLSSLAVHPTEHIAAVGTERGSILLLDLKTGITQRMLNAHVGTVTGMHFSLDGSFLASTGADTTVRIWGTSDGNLDLKSLR